MKLGELSTVIQSVVKNIESITQNISVSVKAEHAKQIVIEAADGVVTSVKATFVQALLSEGENILESFAIDDPLVELPVEVGISLLKELAAKSTAAPVVSAPPQPAESIETVTPAAQE